MDEYTLEVKGVNGSHSASLFHKGSLVATSEDVSDVKDARKWAAGAANDHREANRPHHRTHFTETFTL